MSLSWRSGPRVSSPARSMRVPFIISICTTPSQRLRCPGGSNKHLLDLSEELASRGVDLTSLSDPIDTSTPHGKAFFRIMGVLAEMERDMIRERTIAGVRAAQARRKHCGRPRVLGRDQLVLARQMLSEGQSQRRVARVLKVSDATLSRRLREAV